MMHPKSHYTYFILLILLAFSNCQPNLHSATLPNAQLSESYEFGLYGEDNDLWSSGSLVYEKTGGSLPDGVYVTTGGYIAGTPTELGNFEFKVTMYDIDRGLDDDVDSDSEWYTFFVTEPSTNEDCPEPKNTSTTGVYLCLGDLSSTSVLADDEFSLDVNLFVQHSKASDYDIDYIDLSVTFDADKFYIDEADLTGNIAREALTRAEGVVEFEIISESELRIRITKGSKSFHKSGRILDIPIFALADLVDDTYDFGITIHEVRSEHDDVSLPTPYEVDGSLVVSAE